MFYSSLTFGFDEPQFLYFPNNGFASLLFWTKLHALKRHVSREIKSIDYNKQQIQENANWKRYEVAVLIPLDDCNYILEELNSDQFERVVVNKEYFFHKF